MPTYDLKDASKLLGKLKGTLAKQAGNALYSAALRGVSLLQTRLIPQAVPSPVDRGNYRAGWRVEPHMSGGTIDGADIYNVELHAIFRELGVRAENVKIGKKMIDALAEWAKRKGLEGADDPKAARSIAFAIAHRMREHGQMGLHLLEKLMHEHMPGLVREEVASILRAAASGR